MFSDESESCVAAFLGTLVPHLMRGAGKDVSLDVGQQSRQLAIDQHV